MKIIQFCSFLLFLSNVINSETPHLNYRYSSFAVPNPREAVEFLSKYVTGYVLNTGEILAKPLSTNPERSEIQGKEINERKYIHILSPIYNRRAHLIVEHAGKIFLFVKGNFFSKRFMKIYTFPIFHQFFPLNF